MMGLCGFWFYGNCFEEFLFVLLCMGCLYIFDFDCNCLGGFFDLYLLCVLCVFFYDYNFVIGFLCVVDIVFFVGEGVVECMVECDEFMYWFLFWCLVWVFEDEEEEDLFIGGVGFWVLGVFRGSFCVLEVVL